MMKSRNVNGIGWILPEDPSVSRFLVPMFEGSGYRAQQARVSWNSIGMFREESSTATAHSSSYVYLISIRGPDIRSRNPVYSTPLAMPSPLPWSNYTQLVICSSLHFENLYLGIGWRGRGGGGYCWDLLGCYSMSQRVHVGIWDILGP